MIIPMYDTTANAIADKLVAVRRQGGVVALSRVLTLLVPVGAGQAEQAIAAANAASMEHPCRVIVLVERDASGEPTLDAEIRIGGDAGASEVVVLRLRGPLVEQRNSLVTPLLLPDVPVVTWWPDRLPDCPMNMPLGQLADHRVTDSRTASDPLDARLRRLREGYRPGDTDLAWTCLTWWRAHLASLLDRPPYEKVEAVTIAGRSGDPSVTLLAAWLGWKQDCDVTIVRQPAADGVTRVDLHRASGDLAIGRVPGSDEAVVSVPGFADQRIRLGPRGLADCLSEELRRLDEDVVYGNVVGQALPWLVNSGRVRYADDPADRIVLDHHA